MEVRQLPRHRGRSPTKPHSNGSERVARSNTPRDLLPLTHRQMTRRPHTHTRTDTPSGIDQPPNRSTRPAKPTANRPIQLPSRTTLPHLNNLSIREPLRHNTPPNETPTLTEMLHSRIEITLYWWVALGSSAGRLLLRVLVGECVVLYWLLYGSIF